MRDYYYKGLPIKCVRKIFGKTNISYPLIQTRTAACQVVKNVSFLENFACVLHEESLTKYGGYSGLYSRFPA